MRVLIAFQLVAFTCSAQSIRLSNHQSDIPSSIRGLSVVNDKVAWFSGAKGYVGRTVDGGVNWKYAPIKLYETLDFRTLYALDSLTAIAASAGSPAIILRTTNGGRSWLKVYENTHPDAFFDGIDFWDLQAGLIYGDPIDGKMLLLKTTDGGNTWHEISFLSRPALEKGEASFAASGTGIRCYQENNVVIATGGVVSRLWFSSDGGDNWTPATSPIMQGKPSTGIFSVGVSMNKWIIVGGDYVADTLSVKSSFFSFDAGKTWKEPATSTRGYRSSVEFISKSKWLAVGPRGIDLTLDNGNTWIGVSDEMGFHVVRKSRKGNKVFVAGTGKVAEIIFGK